MLGELLAQYFIQTETNFTKTKQNKKILLLLFPGYLSTCVILESSPVYC